MSEPAKTEPVVTFEGLDHDADRPVTPDLRGITAKTRDRAAHRQYHWLYEDLLN